MEKKEPGQQSQKASQNQPEASRNHQEALQNHVEPEEMTLHDIQEDIPEPQPAEQPEEIKEHPVEVTEMVDSENEQVQGQSSIEDFPECMPAPVEADQTVTYEQLHEKAINVTKYNILGRLEFYRNKPIPGCTMENLKKEIAKLLEILKEMEEKQ